MLSPIARPTGLSDDSITLHLPVLISGLHLQRRAGLDAFAVHVGGTLLREQRRKEEGAVRLGMRSLCNSPAGAYPIRIIAGTSPSEPIT